MTERNHSMLYFLGSWRWSIRSAYFLICILGYFCFNLTCIFVYLHFPTISATEKMYLFATLMLLFAPIPRTTSNDTLSVAQKKNLAKQTILLFPGTFRWMASGRVKIQIQIKYKWKASAVFSSLMRGGISAVYIYGNLKVTRIQECQHQPPGICKKSLYSKVSWQMPQNLMTNTFWSEQKINLMMQEVGFSKKASKTKFTHLRQYGSKLCHLFMLFLTPQNTKSNALKDCVAEWCQCFIQYLSCQVHRSQICQRAISVQKKFGWKDCV